MPNPTDTTHTKYVAAEAAIETCDGDNYTVYASDGERVYRYTVPTSLESAEKVAKELNQCGRQSVIIVPDALELYRACVTVLEAAMSLEDDETSLSEDVIKQVRASVFAVALNKLSKGE